MLPLLLSPSCNKKKKQSLLKNISPLRELVFCEAVSLPAPPGQTHFLEATLKDRRPGTFRRPRVKCDTRQTAEKVRFLFFSIGCHFSSNPLSIFLSLIYFPIHYLSRDN